MEKVYGDNPRGVTLKGRYYVTLYGPDGIVKQRLESQNVVCTNGKEFLASFLYSAALAPATFTCKYVAIGTDATAEAAANTALGIEASRHTATVSYVSNQMFRLTATFATGSGTGAIVEYGVFSSNTGGTMLSRDTESVINKGASDTLTVVWNLTIS
jgi:hypothetical protein